MRLQRFPDGSTLRDVPGLFKIGFIFDPWGTRIELVEDKEDLGFHHVHLSATDPEATLAWYRDTMGGEPASLKGMLNGLRFGDIWLLASDHPDGTPATTEGRAIDHIAFVVDDMDAAVAEFRGQNVEFETEPAVPDGGRTAARRAFVFGPDRVRVALIESGFAGMDTDIGSTILTSELDSFDPPQTPWGEPDLQGIWTSGLRVRTGRSLPKRRSPGTKDGCSVVSGATNANGETRRSSTALPCRRKWPW